MAIARERRQAAATLTAPAEALATPQAPPAPEAQSG
jgi:hypothetical protein